MERSHLHVAARAVVCALGMAALPIDIHAAEFTAAPLYAPGPGAALNDLVQWKVAWLQASIKARTSAIHGKETALNLDPEREKKAAQQEIDSLKQDNTREEDEINALRAPNAFDPKIAGTNQNVQLLRDNVSSAVNSQHGLAVSLINESKDERKTAAEREDAAKKSKQYADSETKLSQDMAAANDGPLKPFKL
jgi:cell division protein FtsB